METNNKFSRATKTELKQIIEEKDKTIANLKAVLKDTEEVLKNTRKSMENLIAEARSEKAAFEIRTSSLHLKAW